MATIYDEGQELGSFAPMNSAGQSFIAYDYDRQKWTTGEEARTVRRQQLVTELEILRSDRARAYLGIIRNGNSMILPEAIEACEAELATLQQSSPAEIAQAEHDLGVE